jgi:basic amino acid/polyamine antiporter, APA family
VPHYLVPIWSGFTEAGGEIVTGGLVIALVAVLNIIGFTGSHRQRSLLVVTLAGIGLLVAVIVVGALTSLDFGALTAELDLFTSPSLEDVIYAGIVATVAFAGIEAGANLAPDVEFERADLRRLIIAASVIVPVLYVGVALIALMAVPVMATPSGPETALGGPFIEDPLLGVVQSFEPAWVSDTLEVAVVVIVPLALIWAASNAMLGLSRHAYVLATNRQIPSWLGKLGARFRTPHVAILSAAALAFGLVLPTDTAFLAGLFAFGATIAFTIAHLSVIRLRTTAPDAERPFRVPFDVTIRGAEVPLPALFAAVLTALAWGSIVVLNEEAVAVGAGWMAFGLVAYVIYRKVFEQTSLTRRVVVPEEALVKDVGEAEYGDILVPVFGTPLDDDIVGTAGRLADAAEVPGEVEPKLEVIYVVDLPLAVPLGSPPPPDRMEIANRALERAQAVGEEYETVEVHPSVVRARSIGAGIVQAARDRDVEVIVMGAEPPTKVRGGAILGGLGGSRPAEIGPVTEYVLRRAPCRVLITAPPADGTPRAAEAERGETEEAERPAS